MPRREVVTTDEYAALGQVVAELVARVNELSADAGPPQLRVRTVVSIPTDPIDDGGT